MGQLVTKGWGHEDIWVSTNKYCGKFLCFNTGAMFSMHFHAEKEETWYVLEGEFTVRWIDTNTSQIHEATLKPGDIWHNRPLSPHQLICNQQGRIIEVSTPDSMEDNFRVMPGDSQK